MSEDSEAELGCVEEQKVYSLVGDPLTKAAQGEYVSSLASVRLMAPCLPGKIVAVAINFPGIDGYHAEMQEPMVFIKPGTSVCGPGETVVNPFPELPMWGEAELAVVVKQIPQNASSQEVRDGILGFTIGNDVTVENIENRDHHLARSKCADAFCPIGPWIDTGFDASDCLIEGIQSNEVIRSGRSSEQVWKWPQIISWLSTWMTLNPWDVVLTGNPPDTCGMRYIEDGDIYTASVEGLGRLTNGFVISRKEK